MRSLNDIINTLKHDGSNPNINKEAIVEALSDLELVAEEVEQLSKVTYFEAVVNGVGNRTRVPIYTKGALHHNVCYFVINEKFKNETESAISGSNITFVFTIPEDISKKIHCFDGTTLDESDSQARVCSLVYGTGEWFNNTSQSAVMRYSKNKITFTLSCPAINAGQETYLVGRVFLTLF